MGVGRRRSIYICVYMLSLACSSNSLPPIYLKFHPNCVGYLPPILFNFVGYLPPILLVIPLILSVIYPNFVGYLPTILSNFVGYLPPILLVIYPQFCQ